MHASSTTGRHKERGAALIVGLILLVVVTVLAISGMNTATTELAIARNDQAREFAFQAAEAGIERALALPAFAPKDKDTPKVLEHTIDARTEVTSALTFKNATPVPPNRRTGAFSTSGNCCSAYHFAVEVHVAGGTADTDRDATAVHTQGFYVVGPKAPTL